jgi:phage recombination protein Bet
MSDTKDPGTAGAVQLAGLPESVVRRGITEAQWRTLVNNLFPGAHLNSVLMVWDYCAARGLDPMKKPCHIVPMEVKDAKTNTYAWRDVVMPGIYEYRITAHRTNQYLGHSEPEHGPLMEQLGVAAPEWCKVTVYRWNTLAQQKVAYPVTVYFSEVVATRKDKQTGAIVANARWSRAPRQMLAKCAEAAALREAFPEEIGGEPTMEEMDGQRSVQVSVHEPEPLEAQELPAIALLANVPDALADNIGKAYADLKLSTPIADGSGWTPTGLGLAKLNEFLGGDGVDLEAGAIQLLTWCRDEYARRNTRAPMKRKSEGNGKTPKPTTTSQNPDITPDTSDPVVRNVSPAPTEPAQKVDIPAFVSPSTATIDETEALF